MYNKQLKMCSNRGMRLKRATVGMMVIVSAVCVGRWPAGAGAAAVSSTAAPAPCELAPAHAQPADAFYRLGIAGEPDLFLPGELYTVSLQGVDSGQGPTPFVGFTIWAEVDEEPSKDGNASDASANHMLGAFQAYDAQTKPFEFCKPAVGNATAHTKTEIQVIWSAPVKSGEVCLRLCARADPSAGVVSEDRGGVGVGQGQRQGSGAVAGSVLARKICAAPAAPASFVRQPPIVEPCCACDEAKYEVTFEGLWSRNTHPREFPPESAQAHFGDVIGASHTAQYRVWQEGRVASAGLRRLAEDGTTTTLEKELKAESEHIRTIIKARGISWQQILGAGAANTFAVFRVDARHHLVSLASKLWPSPDWIVGVSALELCRANCSWAAAASLPLYPYDAGTDSGISYTSRRQATLPPAPVRALRPDWPRDPRSPFYSAAGDMRPFARLRLTRLQLFEKNCDAAKLSSESGAESLSRGTGGAGAGGGGGAGAGGGACATHAWGAWSACSVSCGAGRASRQRQYVWPSRAYAEACRVPLTDYRRCHGPRMHCRAVSEYEPEAGSSSGRCALSAWSAWGPCAGCGVRARRRHYLAPRAHKRCHRGFRARAATSQAMPCDAGPCHRPANMTNSTNFDWFFVDEPGWPCKTTPWSAWSPCSAACGRGRQLRTRLYLAPDARAQPELARRLLDKWNRRFAELQNLEIPVVNATSVDPEVEKLVEEQLEKCQFTLSVQEALCDGDDGACADAVVPLEVCRLPHAVGHCRGYSERWFYAAARAACEPFGYSGCGGNANNFRSRDHCLRACRGLANLTTTQPPAAVPTTHSDVIIKRLKPTPPPSDNEVIQNDEPVPHGGDVVKCKLGPWTGWSECFGVCGFGVKLNYRLVEGAGAGAGGACRRVVKSRSCRPDRCRALRPTRGPGTRGAGPAETTTFINHPQTTFHV